MSKNQIPRILSKQQNEELKDLVKESNHCCIDFDRLGVCPHGDTCSFIHTQSAFPRVVILHHIYPNPDFFYTCLGEEKAPIPDTFRTSLFDAFYYDLYAECAQFGQVLDIIVAKNIQYHLYGTAWVQFQDSDSAIAAQKALNNRFYAGKKIKATLWNTHKLSKFLCDGKKTRCIAGGFCQLIHSLEPSDYVRELCFNRLAVITPTEDLSIKENELTISPAKIQAEGLI